MGEIIVVKIACEDGTLYALGNDLSIIQINSDDNRITIPVDDINTEAITDFKVKNGVLYIVTSEGDVGTTYILNTKGEIKERNIKKLKGRIFDENTIYQVELLPEEGHSIGHSCEMKIIDIKSGDTESIILESEYWVVGAQFLGYDSDGNYRIKMFEMATNENFNIVVEETIRTIGKDGSTKAIRGLDTQFKSITNQVKVFGNDIYELNNLKDKVQIINISEPNEKTTSSYKSKLQNIVEPISDLDPDITNGDNQLMISRSTIMSNAKSFHSSFRWSCQSKNLEPLTNWTKPRYVSRCWGTSTKYGTSTIMNIAKKINASDLLEGDALNNSGSHIVLFEKYDGAGNYVLYESTKLNSYDRVSHTVRSISSMGNYVPIRYNGVSK